MSLSIYEIVVPAMIHGLGVLDDYVGHAERLAESRRMPVSEVLAARLAPDMLSFGDQIVVVCNKVEAHVAKLAQRSAPAPLKVLPTVAALRCAWRIRPAI
jgi:hypothetical protein